MLQPSCKVVIVNPRTDLTIVQSSWTKTDLHYSLVLTKLSHVIIMYQLSGWNSNINNYYLANRIKINSIIQKHTVYHSGRTAYYGNFGSWQGSLDTGTHNILVEYHNNHKATSKSGAWETRALTIVYC